MPITDYGKTVIYKIVCNDLTIKQCYVGHTTDMTKRKYAHKSCCHNEKDKDHNHKIYKIIREKGGWSNWSMLLVEKFPCKDNHEACRRERELYEQLDSKMNMVRPYITQAELEQYEKQYLEENKEEIKQYYEQYREENKEEIAEKKKQYYEANKEQLKQYNKQYREDHKEYYKDYQKKYREEHREEKQDYHKQYNKNYYQENKEEIIEKYKQKIECKFCHKLRTKWNMSRHIKTCKSKPKEEK